MTLKTIYIARHGYRSNWLPEPHPPNPTGIDSDPPLAPHGVDQAKQLAAYLHSLPSIEQPQFIISSPFYRCVETCQPIAQILSLSVVIERGVGEWYRKGRKVIPSPANYDTLHRFFKDVLVEESEWPRDETIGIIPSLSGETPEEIFDRASLFWKKFFPIFENKYPHIESILIVTHAATKIALGTSLLGLSTVYDSIDEHGTKPRAGACSLDKYIKSNSNQWENVMNGNCEFLLKGEEMHWDFSITVEAGSDEDIKLRKLKELELQKQNENKKQIKDTTPVTEIATGQENDDEFEDVYVTVDIPMFGKSQAFDDATSNTNTSTNHNNNNNNNNPSSKVNYIKPSSHFQFTDLNNENPLIKLSNNASIAGPGGNDNEGGIDNINIIDGKIYETNWKKLIGTDLIFDDYGELIGKVHEHLTISENVKIIAKDSNKIKTEDDADETTGDIEMEDSNENDHTFLNRAIKYAKKKAVDTT